MDSERPHRTGSSSNSSELFICFTSRLSSSSSSMKISSKSIHSPGRTDKFRESTQISLSSSLSKRLRSSGSMKGGQSSPMFPTGNKKRGGAFENPEPSSPKVTCIGQVRVKTKKQGKKLRTRSGRRGEVSFRKIEQGTTQELQLSHQHSGFQQQQQQECLRHRNQRWVHLPLTICEALRAFGAEFNCFLPCRSSCLSTSEREKEEKASGSNGSNDTSCESEGSNTRSCGAVFARWLVALQEGEVKRRDIELVVGEDEERTEEISFHRRRQVMEDIEIKCEEKNGMASEEQEGRMSVCVPPKNALLLMRCRSDPLRMAALANRFWDSPKKEEDFIDEDEENESEGNEQEPGNVEDVILEIEEKSGLEPLDINHGEVDVSGKWVLEEEIPEEDAKSKEEKEENVEISPEIMVEKEEKSEILEETEANNQKSEVEVEEKAEEEETELFSALTNPEICENEEESEFKMLQEENGELEDKPANNIDDERRTSLDISHLVSLQQEEKEEDVKGGEDEEREDTETEETEESTTEKETSERCSQEEETVTHESSEPEIHGEQEEELKSEDRESDAVQRNTRPNQQRESSGLPDCLLLMMCEPKLSMEVSRETWVCSTDFIRALPERPPVGKKDGVDEPKKRVSIDINPAPTTRPAPHILQQPPRSSCSFPAPPPGVSMATMIEQKLGNAAAYEPFVLTRCKSEPMRSAAKLAAPEACFWKNRKLEPHRGGTVGVGAAGLGF